MHWLSFWTALIFFVGAVVLMAPTIANWFSQVEQAGEINVLGDEVRNLGAETLQKAIAEAMRYNTSLTGGALVAANERIPLPESAIGDADHFDYEQLLKADSRGLMARLKIPVIGVDLPVYHGTSDQTLSEGVGQLEGTALPVGGPGTRSVLTAHRGLATSVLFTNLDVVGLDDTFTIEVFGQVLTYRVVSTEVVAPENSTAIFPEIGRDLVTLVTCTPLGINSHRILVTGERVLPTPANELAKAGGPPEIPGFPWWIVILGGVASVLTLYVWNAGRPPRNRSTVARSPEV